MSAFLSPPTSVNLLSRLRQQKTDEDAWFTLLRRYEPLVRSWCCRLLSPCDAEEVTQTIWIKLVKELRRFAYDPEKGRFRGWLRTMVENEIASYWARVLGRPDSPRGEVAALLSNLPGPCSLEAFAADLDERIRADLQDAHQICVCIQQRVEPHNWQAFWRITVEGQPPAEVARQLGITLHAACQANRRIVAMLHREAQRLFPERFSDSTDGGE